MMLRIPGELQKDQQILGKDKLISGLEKDNQRKAYVIRNQKKHINVLLGCSSAERKKTEFYERKNKHLTQQIDKLELEARDDIHHVHINSARMICWKNQEIAQKDRKVQEQARKISDKDEQLSAFSAKIEELTNRIYELETVDNGYDDQYAPENNAQDEEYNVASAQSSLEQQQYFSPEDSFASQSWFGSQPVLAPPMQSMVLQPLCSMPGYLILIKLACHTILYGLIFNCRRIQMHYLHRIFF